RHASPLERRHSLKTDRLLVPIVIVQALLGIRVIWRMVRSAGGERITADHFRSASGAEGRPQGIAPTMDDAARDAIDWIPTPIKERVSVIVPVLNERNRLSSCLEGLIAQGAEVHEILVVDGGSNDGTQELVCTYAQRDPRMRLVDASPVPTNCNGKAWGMQVGLCSASPGSDWILTVDADVRPRALLTSALLAHAKRAKLTALSVATLQEIESLGEGLLHPSLLTTIVYRFGMPGKVARRVSEVQANGQCFLFSRGALESCGGFLGTFNSICEDVTIARTLVAAGYPVGFYEAGDLVTVKMYADWRDTWRNWTRSLPMHDRFSDIYTLIGWLEVVLVQALPLPLVLFLIISRLGNRGRRQGAINRDVVSARRQRSWPMMLNSILLALRIGVLFGTARAYQRRPWSYWLSPLCDLPVAVQLVRSMLQRRHIWRGRVLVRGEMS
ncbi:MAG TPA: glycosyltransferase family 2 protein, partial [Ktedonobacteraceae bacterium]